MITQSLLPIGTPKCYQGTKKYRSDNGESTFIYDILPDALSLYAELNPVMWRATKDSGLKTVFLEVEIVSFDEANPHAKGQLKPLENIERETVSEERYANIMWDAFRGAIKDLWKPACKHYVFASSGYDSRLMAYAIMSLYEQLGDAWLGDLWFVEADGEAEQFRKNMEMIGWQRNRCIVYNEGAPSHEYHERSFDFNTAWEKLGGMCGFPVNFNWEALLWLQEKGLMAWDTPEIEVLKEPYVPGNVTDIQVFFGYSSNEIATTMRFNRTLYEYFKDSYRRGLSGPRRKIGSMVVPFHHFDVITSVLKYGNDHIMPNTGLAQTILKYIAPKQLAEIPSPKHHTKHATVRRISERLLDKTLSDYKKSWFGKQYPNIKPLAVIKYDHWWAHWCVASFCEHLLREGFKLEIR